jgi:phosphopantetheinyl transferase
MCSISGVVDVWHVDLGEATYDGLVELLCAQEQARAARIVHAHKRTLWTRSHGILRALLGRYLDADPRALLFAPGPHGKPRLWDRAEGDAGLGRESNLRFNLSHSDELMLVAVTTGREVGMDLEVARERYTSEFLRTWTMREATVKCLGTGLGSAPVAGEGATSAGMWTAELDVGPRAFAAIAVAGGEECVLHRRDWPG